MSEVGESDDDACDDADNRATFTGPVESRSLAEPVDDSDSESEQGRSLSGSPSIRRPGARTTALNDSESEESTTAKNSAAVASETHEASKTSEAAAAHDALQIDEDDEDSCPICFDIPKNGFRTPCGHVFCSTCLADALHRNDSCPVCRSKGVHNCATRADDCPLCVAGHTPGVVVANVFVSQEENVLRSTARLAVTFSKIWCQVTSFSIGTVVLGFWLCEIGVLSILSFAMVCIGVTLVCCLVIYYRTSRAINRVIPADIPA